MSNKELVRQHKEICNLLNEIYEQKNKAYGNSFGDTYKDLGIISAVTRISDKFNRLKTIAKNKDINQGDESISDTLLDMANYCIMTYMELQNEKLTVYAQGGMMIDKEFVGKICDGEKIPPHQPFEISQALKDAAEKAMSDGEMSDSMVRFLHEVNKTVKENEK